MLNLNQKCDNIRLYIICQCIVLYIFKSKQLRKDKNKSKKIPQISQKIGKKEVNIKSKQKNYKKYKFTTEKTLTNKLNTSIIKEMK